MAGRHESHYEHGL